MDRIDDFVNKLQAEIFDDARQVYGEKGFQRWRHPRYNGRMDDPDAYARVTGTCGDTIELFLKFEGNRVNQATYVTDGCASSSISGSFAAELTIGKDPDELADITAEAVLNQIGRLPEEDKHCATLAATTIHEAVDQYMSGLKNQKR